MTSTEDVLSLMRTAQASRKIGETKLNKHSSRSHCIFTVSVYTKQKLSEEEEVDYHGKLHLVDLAGSECAKNASLHKRSTSVSKKMSLLNVYAISNNLLIFCLVGRVNMQEKEKG